MWNVCRGRGEGDVVVSKQKCFCFSDVGICCSFCCLQVNPWILDCWLEKTIFKMSLHFIDDKMIMIKWSTIVIIGLCILGAWGLHVTWRKTTLCLNWLISIPERDLTGRRPSVPWWDTHTITVKNSSFCIDTHRGMRWATITAHHTSFCSCVGCHSYQQLFLTQSIHKLCDSLQLRQRLLCSRNSGTHSWVM